jgi:hypothetical protein
MLATIDTNSDQLGQFFMAGILAFIACDTFISGFPANRRATAKWKRGWRRTLFGTIAFSTGAGMICVALLLHIAINGPRAPFTGIALWLVYPEYRFSF